MIFMLVWLLGSLCSLAFWGYMKGRADLAFDRNQGSLDNPPFIIGMLTSPLWGLQVAFGLIWAICHISVRKGREESLALNQQYAMMRDVYQKLQKEESRTWAMLMANNVDPDNLDDQTKRALTARSIEWAMEEEAARKREESHLPATLRKKVDPVYDESMFEILDKAGVKVNSLAYDEYQEARKGPLDL